LANSKWFKIVNYRDFTLYLTKKSEWKQIVDRIEKYQPTSLKLKNNIVDEPTDILEHLTRLTSLEYFDIAKGPSRFVPNLVIDWQGLTLMTKLKSLKGFHNVSLDVWKKLPQLETFVFSFDVARYQNLLDVVLNLTNLRELEIRLNEENVNPFEMITSAHSNLTSLEFQFLSVRSWTDADLQRLKNIKKLYFHLNDTYPKDEMAVLSLKYLTALEDLSTEFQIADLITTKLKRLQMEFVTEAEKRLFPFMESVEYLGPMVAEENMEYLTSLTRLRSIDLRERSGNMADNRKYSILGNIASSRLTYMSMSFQRQSIDFRYLSQLGSIRQLTLFDTLCDDNVTALTNLENLSFTVIGENYDSTPLWTSLAKLTTLRSLQYLPKGKKTTSIDFSPLTNLESLWLSDSVQFISLYLLTNLTYLILQSTDQNQFWKVPNLETMTNLLVLSCDSYSDVILYVTALCNLQMLCIHSCNSNEELESLATLSKLTYLAVETMDDNVNGVLLTRLTNLQELQWPALHDEEAQQIIAAVPNLREFYYQKQ
jgi:hypothetical protein